MNNVGWMGGERETHTEQELEIWEEGEGKNH